jgi:hypothetical protein
MRPPLPPRDQPIDHDVQVRFDVQPLHVVQHGHAFVPRRAVGHVRRARMTVQQALRILRDEGLTVSRPGSGVFVREKTARAVSLPRQAERAFKAEDVRIDFIGSTSKTPHAAPADLLDKIRSGRLNPSSVRRADILMNALFERATAQCEQPELV